MTRHSINGKTYKVRYAKITSTFCERCALNNREDCWDGPTHARCSKLVRRNRHSYEYRHGYFVRARRTPWELIILLVALLACAAIGYVADRVPLFSRQTEATTR